MNILLGITGSIAAYKSPELARRLSEKNHVVRAVMTDSAKAFITPLTLQAVTGHTVYHGLFESEINSGMDHIALARWANLILIAPATAHCIAKLASGFADDLLSTLCLVTQAPIIIAPAMNTHMWEHKAVQRNVEQLKQDGLRFLAPDTGTLACGEVGQGAMMSVDAIVQTIN